MAALSCEYFLLLKKLCAKKLIKMFILSPIFLLQVFLERINSWIGAGLHSLGGYIGDLRSTYRKTYPSSFFFSKEETRFL